jgi:hypothetical protein
LTRTLSKLEERIAKRERIIEEKGNEIEKLQKVIQNLEMVSTSQMLKAQSHFTTDDQSVSPSWCRAPSEAHDQILITV